MVVWGDIIMFKVNDIPGKEIVEAILHCQENEDPYVRVIDSKGLFIEPLPPRINLNKNDEWIESGKKSPTAWRLDVDDDFHFVKVKKKKKNR